MCALFIIFLSCLSVKVIAQDKIYGFYKYLLSGNATAPNMPVSLQQIQFTPTNNSVSINWSDAANGRPINYIGLNKEHYLYSIEDVNTDEFHINSFNTLNNFSTTRVFTSIDLNGGLGTDARIRGMAIDKNGVAWIAAFSVVDGKNYLSTFKTSSKGGGSDFITKPYTYTTDIPSFEVKDLAFDMFGKMYVLVLDAISGFQFIYYADIKIIGALTPGNSIPLTKLWQISEAPNKPIKFDPKYNSSNFPDFQSMIAEGLAFDSEGNLLISVDKMTFTNSQNGIEAYVSNMLYSYSPEKGDNIPRVEIFSSPNGKSDITYCDDLASNYFPAFMPTQFGEVKATLDRNKLKVIWTTESEKNNVKFNVSISADGSSFSDIGTINSQAPNGNSNQTSEYVLDYDITNSSVVSMISFWFLLIISTIHLTKNKSRWLACLSILIILFFSCSKKNNPNNEIESYTGKLFVKVTAIDKKSKTTDSKIILAER